MTIAFDTTRDTTRRSSLRFAVLGGLVGATLGLGVSAATPALADDDGAGSIFGTVVSTVMGVGKPKDVELPIDYRERAPLVVPPKRDLPAPLPSASQRSAAWPNDPDVVAVRKAGALARAPVPLPGNGADKLGHDEMMRGRTAGSVATAPAALQCDELISRNCANQTQLWDSLRTKKADTSTEVALQPGVEPTRDYLTQPPRGYLSPRKVAKYTFDAPSKNFADDSIGDAAKYTREQSRRKTSVDDE